MPNSNPICIKSPALALRTFGGGIRLTLEAGSWQFKTLNPSDLPFGKQLTSFIQTFETRSLPFIFIAPLFCPAFHMEAL